MTSVAIESLFRRKEIAVAGALVALVVLAGGGTLVVDGDEHSLRGGTLAIVPRGATRSVVAGADGLRCLSLHRRRGGLAIGRATSRTAAPD